MASTSGEFNNRADSARLSGAWIQEDYGYNALNDSIFQGEGLDKIIDKYLE